MRKATLGVVVLALCGSTAFAQMTPQPRCHREANPDWYQLAGTPIGEILDTRFEQNYWMPDGHASSLLPAEGTPPTEPDYEDAEDSEEAELEYLNELANWSCMYGPQRAVDGDPTTAWSEGAPGSGEGEVLVVPLGAGAVEIWTGFGLSDRLHKRNGRPAEVEVTVLQALTGLANQFDLTVGHLVVLARSRSTLEDYNGYQPLSVPAFEPITDHAETRQLLAPFFGDEVPSWASYPGRVSESLFLAVRILSVYEGSVYEDTLISEIRTR